LRRDGFLRFTDTSTEEWFLWAELHQAGKWHLMGGPAGAPGGASHRLLTKKNWPVREALSVTARQNNKMLPDKLSQVLRSSFEAGARLLFALGGLPIRPYWVHAPPHRLGWSRWGEVAH